jgi:hypothetical protein
VALNVSQVTASWNRLTASVNGVTRGVGQLAQQINNLNANMVRTQAMLATNTRAQAQHWGQINTNIQRSHRSLTAYFHTARRIVTLGGIGLLTGSGIGLFGINRMAETVAEGRRTSLGLGMTYGQNRAFDIAFNRFGNAGAIMQSSMEARAGAPSAMTAMYAMGVNPMRSGGSTAQVAGDYLDAVRAKAMGAKNDYELYGMHQGFRMGDAGVDLNMLMRLRNDPGSYEEMKKKFATDQFGLNIQERSQKAWQDFTTAMETAGAKITKIFAEGLDKLAPAFTKLSEGLSTFLSKFVDSDEFKKAIEEIANGIKWLGSYLAGDQWKTDFASFTSGIGAMASVVSKFLSLFGVNTGGGNFPGDSMDYAGTSKSAYYGPSASLGPAHEKSKLYNIFRRFTPFQLQDPSSGIGGGAAGGGGLEQTYPGLFAPRTLRFPGEYKAPFNLYPGIPLHGYGQPNWAPNPGSMPMPQMPLPAYTGKALGGADYSGGVGVQEADIAFFMSDAGGRYTREQAIGIVANIQHESGGRHDIREAGGTGPGYGLAQWTSPDRKAAFRARYNKDITSSTREEQLAFIAWELNNTHAAAGMRLRGTSDAGSASDVIDRQYEIHGMGPGETARRRATAIGIANRPLVGQPYLNIKIDTAAGNNANISAANAGVLVR